MTATQLYGPYGGVRYQSGMLPTDYGFTHQRSDASTSGLDDYGARYYDPVAGQFTSADTTLAGGLNRYAYVGGSPETFVDPSGQYAQVCDTALCGGEDGGIALDGGPTGSAATGSGGRSGVGTVDAPPSEVESDPEGSWSAGGGRSKAGALALVLIFGLIGLTIAGHLGAEVSQGIWHAWQHWQALGAAGSAPHAGSASFARHQSNQLTAANDPPTPPTPPTPSVTSPSSPDATSEGSEPAPQPATDGAGARQGGGRSYVLGETMSRIYDYAATHDVSYYRPWMKGAKNSLPSRNATWLLWVVHSGATIYNIGFDSDRANKSVNYLMEMLILQALNYPMIYDPQPGSKGSQP